MATATTKTTPAERASRSKAESTDVDGRVPASTAATPKPSRATRAGGSKAPKSLDAAERYQEAIELSRQGVTPGKGRPRVDDEVVKQFIRMLKALPCPEGFTLSAGRAETICYRTAPFGCGQQRFMAAWQQVAEEAL